MFIRPWLFSVFAEKIINKEFGMGLAGRKAPSCTQIFTFNNYLKK